MLVACGLPGVSSMLRLRAWPKRMARRWGVGRRYRSGAQMFVCVCGLVRCLVVVGSRDMKNAVKICPPFRWRLFTRSFHF